MPTVDAGGLRADYSDAGDGLPLVFVPGLVGSREWFRYQVSGLADHYRVIACNLRRAQMTGEYSIELLAGDLAGLLDGLRIRTAVVAGHDLGTLVAMRFAALHHDRCVGLVVSSGAPTFAKVPKDELLSQLCPGELKIDGFLARWWKGLFGCEPQRRDTEEEDAPAYLARHNADIDQATLNARLKLLRRTDLTPTLADISVPTLIVAGSADSPAMLAGSQALEQLIADSTLEVLEGADHFCFYTRHDLFNSVVHDYITHGVAGL